MAEEADEKRVAVERLCKKIEDLNKVDYLSEDEKLSFVREALKILSKEK